MAERPEDRRQPRPIVPDPEASLAGHHRSPAPRRAAVWPLWLLILLLIAALVGLAYAGWMERQRLEQRLTRLGGEISNVHARFDASDGRGDRLSQIQSRLDELDGLEEDLNASIEQRLAGWQEARLAPLADAQDELEGRVATLAEDGEVRGDTLASVRASMDALEKAGQQGRAALTERVAGLESARQRDVERLSALGDRQQALTSRLDDVRDTLASLTDDVEGLTASRDDGRERAADLEARLEDAQAELRELRQYQLALNAQLEALRQ
ncbi:hypothetical protein [Halomonas getboli]|uniref:hypothetical protein n=1 Tax=Halomonas getboli TaxID=2935862 RepID=UPI001FFE922F|nr:hypothetical protein [Halomonas getboli]MCK2183187.1 hypothetical protein [Halomonas getboli]